MMPIEEALVKSVASKINYYIDVKQREDGFNLSGSPLWFRKPLYIPVPPQRPRLYGSSSIKRNRFSINSTLQEQPSILVKRRQRTQNLSSYVPIVIGNTKREKIVQTASKFLVSLGFYNDDSPRRRRKKNNADNKSVNKLPSINSRKDYQDFIYDDTGSFSKEELYFDYGEKSPEPSSTAVNSIQLPDPSPTAVNSPQPPNSCPESPTCTLTPKEEVKPSYSISYSDHLTPESYGVLMHCATQTDSDNILKQRNLPTNEDQEYTEIKSGKETEYVVVVKTGNVLGASTRAQVKIVLCGTEGKTGVLNLLKSETNKIKFQKGKEDHFILKTFNVGHLEKVRIGHDRPELPYAWFLDHVTVYDQTEKWMYMFRCGQWFSGEDGDRQTYRELLLEKNMAIVEDIQNVSEEDLLQRLARTENYDKNKEKDLFQETASDRIQTEMHLNDHATLDTSRSDLSSVSNDGSNFGSRFNQGTVISVQNQVTTGTQTNKIPSKLHNLARDFHQPQNDSPMKRSDHNISEDECALSKKPSLKDDDKPEEKGDEGNYTFNGNKKGKKKQTDSQSSSESVSSKEDFYSNE